MWCQESCLLLTQQQVLSYSMARHQVLNILTIVNSRILCTLQLILSEGAQAMLASGAGRVAITRWTSVLHQRPSASQSQGGL